MEDKENKENEKTFGEHTSISFRRQTKPPHLEIKYDAKPKQVIFNNPKAPKNWEKAYQEIYKMRFGQNGVAKNAAVDTMGCSKIYDTTVDPKVKRFQILIGLMLSSQTRDEMTSKAMEKLRAHGLTIPNILKTKDEDLTSLILGVSFHKRKTEYIKKTAKILHDQYNDDIPNTLNGLLALPGVGPKMSHLCLQEAWDKVEGVGVDVHVHRICNRLGWVKSKIPEETNKQLQVWLPKDKWREINYMLVGFGQTICIPRTPKCYQCKASKYCEYYKNNVKPKEKKEKKRKRKQVATTTKNKKSKTENKKEKN